MNTTNEIPLSPQLQRILRMAAIEAEASQSTGVDVTHLLTALAQEANNPGAAIFQQAGLTIDHLRQADYQIKPAKP
ncbi:MAG: hypothetical protein KGL39_03065 [Patescibacteria group bacterium]|nr:hypothetical protein [Patescibacteria group bacterium]